MDFCYDPTSPSGLRWATRGSNRVKLGDVAGYKSPEGYWIVTRSGNKSRRVHSIVWELHNGPVPQGMTVDHIDRNPSNNKIENLRLATPSDQCHNRRNWGQCPKWVKRTKHGKFEARFTLKGKLIQAGNYETEERAHLAAVARRLELYWAL